MEKKKETRSGMEIMNLLQVLYAIWNNYYRVFLDYPLSLMNIFL